MKKRITSLVSAFAIILSAVPSVVTKAEANINIGDYVEMGTYYGKPILWRCVDIDENGPLMLSDRIICLKVFDASGDNTTGSHGRGYNNGEDRKNGGSNYWGDSNIRCWLNSSASAGEVEWTCGNPPDSEHVYGCNAYDDEAGFLTNFTNSELSCIKEVTQDSLLDEYEYPDMSPYGSTYYNHDWDIPDAVQNAKTTAYKESVIDRMFLLDVNQINKVYQNDGKLGGNKYYIGFPTDEAVENSEYKYEHLSSAEWYMSWLRSPSPWQCCGYSSGVCDISFAKEHFDYDINYGVDINFSSDNEGIRPAFYLNQAAVNFASGKGMETEPYTVGDLISVTVNNKKLTFDQNPVIRNDRTLVPLRAIFEALGATVDWDDSTKTVTGKIGNTILKLAIGSNTMYKNNIPITIDVQAQIIGDRTMVPVRAIAEAFDCDVKWDESSKTVLITR